MTPSELCGRGNPTIPAPAVSVRFRLPAPQAVLWPERRRHTKDRANASGTLAGFGAGSVPISITGGIYDRFGAESGGEKGGFPRFRVHHGRSKLFFGIL